MVVNIFLILFGFAILFVYIIIEQQHRHIMALQDEVDRLQKEVKKHSSKKFFKLHSKYEEDYYGPTSYGS